MNITRKYKFYRKVAVCMALVMLAEAFYPTVSWALTSGPGSPEFSSFEPASTTSMVNEFSGSFTYNIPVLEVPGANGGGYSCGLSYHSGETVESEASWVGYGFTLNPGAINRSKRGFADDSNGDDVTYINDVPAHWTVSAGVNAGEIEAFSASLPISTSASLSYNNYKGFGYSVGASYNAPMVSLGYSVSDGEGSFSVQPNVGEYLSNRGARGAGAIALLEAVGTQYGLHKMGDDVRATTATQYSGQRINMKISGVTNPFPIPVGAKIGIEASFTRQKNIPSTTLQAFGYMYSQSAGPDAMMDYYIENPDVYNKRDLYLSAPFSNADIYTASGEGLGGSFRMHNKHVGTFFPNHVKSETAISQLAVSPDMGTTVGVGADIGIGNHTLEVSKNFSSRNDDINNGNSDSYSFSDQGGDEGTFFRFSNDLGGSLNYSSSTSATGASIANRAPSVPDDLKQSLTEVVTENGATRSGRSSYIAYHTNGEMVDPSNGNLTPYAYEKSQSSNNFVDRISLPSGVGEVVAYNTDGNRYVYGLPVYARNESNMQYDLRGISASAIKNRHLAYKNIENPKSQIGEINNSPYATSYLVTEITTPDYLDRSLNGPSDDDFGGYTKFEYDRAYGDNTKTNPGNWYKWRIPYNGLLYTPNSLTDNLDDMGVLSSGEKEVYYLKKIETKTHVAVFVTNKTNFDLGSKHIQGSGTVRQDALDAADNNSAASSQSAKGSNDLQMLERIELYAKPVDGSSDYRLIKTTHFEYDYSLCANMPNNIGSVINKLVNGNDVNINANKGKLTLKKIWFEYENIINARISPYKFDYQYPTNITTNNGIPSAYSNILDYGSGLTASMQNPVYDPLNLDRWGSPNPDGIQRHSTLNPWVDQTPADFDPAAWQLKKITLPSGGEILVQYEQHDYLYVQDRKAMAMVSLKELTTAQMATQDKFYLNVEGDLGVTGGQLEELKNVIKKELVDKDQKIYFKFLYALVGADPRIGNCTSDYVSGYVNIKDVGVDNDGLYIEVGDNNLSNIYTLPKKVCIDYVQREKAGKLNNKQGCGPDDGIPEGNDPVSIAKQLLNFVGVSLVPAASCLTLNESLSYLRIPVLNAKKGGGIRVKRVLMHDKGIETGDEALYGTEYFYTNVDGTSSGVATNEPSLGREENALVTFLPKRTDESIWKKAIAGKDKQQYEGPLGEHLLPGASVGYSRVVAKSIHSGQRTNTGFVVNEFYTVKDYPFDKYYNNSGITGKGVDNTGISQDKNWKLIPAAFVSVIINNLWLSQGYRFILNEMHGQQKSIATYAGDYTPGTPVASMLSSKQEFTFFEPGEEVPMMTDVKSPIVMGNPGKETEVVMERKAVNDIGIDGKVSVDLQMSLLFPFLAVYPTGMPSFSYSESKLQTHVTSKIVKYPAILKKVTTFQDGIYHVTQNLAFSPTTGEPLLTKTTDGYNQQNLQQSSNHDGSYLAYEIPATSAYKEMGQKAANERRKLTSNSPAFTMTLINITSDYYLEFASASGSVCNAMNTFSRGDLIKIDGTSSTVGFFNTDEIVGSRIKVLPAALYNPTVNIGNGNVASVEIVRSGKTNQLSSVVGSFTTYGAKQNPVVTVIPTGTLQPRIDFATLLNNTLLNPSLTPVSYTITPSQITGGLQFINPLNSDDCGSLTDNIYVKVDKGNKQITVDFGGSNGTPDPSNPNIEIIPNHPMVNFLNQQLDLWWFMNLDNNPPSPSNYNLVGCSPQIKFYSPTNIPTTGFLNTNIDISVLIDAVSNQTTFNDVNGGVSAPIHFDPKVADPSSGVEYGVFALNSNPNGAILGAPQTSNNWLSSITLTYGGANLVYSTIASSNHCWLWLHKWGTGALDRYYIGTSTPQIGPSPYFTLGANNVYRKSLYTELFGKFIEDNDGYLKFIDADYSEPHGPDFRFSNIRFYKNLPSPAKCSFTLPMSGSGDNFSVDSNTGELKYNTGDNPCNSQDVSCINFCPNVSSSISINNVIASSAASYDCTWPYDESLFSASAAGANDYEKGIKGKWRMNQSFVYNSTVRSGSKKLTPERNYKDAGIYAMELFNWENSTANDTAKWIRTSTVSAYSPNGEAIEKSDALYVKSAAKYGYKGKLPYLVAKNSDYASSQFESFENLYAGNKVEEGVSIVLGQIDNTAAHSGKFSLRLSNIASTQGTPSAGNFVMKPIPVTSQITTNGLNLKVWVKNDPLASGLPIAIKLSQAGNPSVRQDITNLKKVAQTGEWTLYEATILPTASLHFTSIVVTIMSATTNNNIWIDDVRVQPYDAQVMSYVYDNKTMRLLASFDDQHFGLFYQYNAEGKLVRKLIETERGIKTVQESQYHTPLEARDQ